MFFSSAASQAIVSNFCFANLDFSRNMIRICSSVHGKICFDVSFLSKLSSLFLCTQRGCVDSNDVNSSNTTALILQYSHNPIHSKNQASPASTVRVVSIFSSSS